METVPKRGQTTEVRAGDGLVVEKAAAPEKVLVLCSGGLDSTVLLARAVALQGAGNVTALSIAYGQRHVRELRSAEAVCAFYGVPLRRLDLGAVFAGSSCSLLAASAAPVPHESYIEQKARDGEGPVSTYVPFRNGLFLSAAASVALSCGCTVLAYGAHADDWAGSAYPDCSPAFVAAMDRAIREGTAGELRIEAPFITCDKAEIVRQGLALGAPLHLTWSCYEGGEEPCGSCATCIDRRLAFEANGVPDPALPAPPASGPAPDALDAPDAPGACS